jgi:hypothetical protein
MLLACALLFGAQAAYACTCLQLSAGEKLKESEAVFVGEVLAVSKDLEKQTMAINFKVERYWKGVTYHEVLVVTYLPGPGSCGLWAEVGDKYLIYASRKKQLHTSACTSLRLKAATEDLKKLGKGKVLKPRR